MSKGETSKKINKFADSMFWTSIAKKGWKKGKNLGEKGATALGAPGAAPVFGKVVGGVGAVGGFAVGAGITDFIGAGAFVAWGGWKIGKGVYRRMQGQDGELPPIDEIEELKRNDHLFQAVKNSDKEVMVRRTNDREFPLVMKMPEVVTVKPLRSDNPLYDASLYKEVAELASNANLKYRSGDDIMMIHQEGRSWSLLSPDGKSSVLIGLGEEKHRSAKELPKGKLFKFHANDITVQGITDLVAQAGGDRSHLRAFPYKLGRYLKSERVPANCEELPELLPLDGKVMLHKPNLDAPQPDNDFLWRKLDPIASRLGYEADDPKTIRVDKNACYLLSKDGTQERQLSGFGEKVWDTMERLRGEDGKITVDPSDPNVPKPDNDLLDEKFRGMALSSGLGDQAGQSFTIYTQKKSCTLMLKDSTPGVRWDVTNAQSWAALQHLQDANGKVTTHKTNPAIPNARNDMFDDHIRPKAIEQGYEADEPLRLHVADRSCSLLFEDGSQEGALVALVDFDERAWNTAQRLSGKELAEAFYAAQESKSEKKVIRKAAFDKDDPDYPILVRDGENVFRLKGKYVKEELHRKFAEEPNVDVFRDVSLHEYVNLPERRPAQCNKFPANATIAAKVIFDEEHDDDRGGYHFEYTHKNIPWKSTLSGGDSALLRAVNGTNFKDQRERMFHLANVRKLLPTPLEETDDPTAEFTLETDDHGDIRCFLTKNSLPVEKPKVPAPVDMPKARADVEEIRPKGLPSSVLTPAQAAQRSALRGIEITQEKFRRPTIPTLKNHGGR